MRFAALLMGLLVLGACKSAPAGSAKMTLNEPYWPRVNVELVITKSADCDNRGPGFISTKTIVMHKNTTESVDVPPDATLCWRHDRDPSKPSPGAWSGWTKATMFPGQSAETDI